MPTTREFAIELPIMIGIAIALAALGPFGSFEMGSFGERLAYWMPISLAGYALFRPITALGRYQAKRLDLPDGAGIVAGVAVAAAPLTLVVLWWNGQGFGSLPNVGDWFQLYLQVALIGSLVTLTFMAAERRFEPPPQGGQVTQGADEPTAASPPLIARLPASWAGSITALEMEDHYVRVHGETSSALILMRLRDAQAEMGALDGALVHRSWWVARDSVEQVVRDGRNFRLRLRGGLEAPVARDRVTKLRAAGWLA